MTRSSRKGKGKGGERGKGRGKGKGKWKGEREMGVSVTDWTSPTKLGGFGSSQDSKQIPPYIMALLILGSRPFLSSNGWNNQERGKWRLSTIKKCPHMLKLDHWELRNSKGHLMVNRVHCRAPQIWIPKIEYYQKMSPQAQIGPQGPEKHQRT